jgi:hypothetical protein
MPDAGNGATVEGADVAARAYQGIADDARDMTEPNRRISAAGEQAARSRAPVATGALAGSIAGDATDRAAELAVGVPYWPVQEFGSRRRVAQRFMAAGIDAMRAAAPDAYRDRMQQIIERRT